MQDIIRHNANIVTDFLRQNNIDSVRIDRPAFVTDILKRRVRANPDNFGEFRRWFTQDWQAI